MTDSIDMAMGRRPEDKGLGPSNSVRDILNPNTPLSSPYEQERGERASSTCVSSPSMDYRGPLVHSVLDRYRRSVGARPKRGTRDANLAAQLKELHALHCGSGEFHKVLTTGTIDFFFETWWIEKPGAIRFAPLHGEHPRLGGEVRADGTRNPNNIEIVSIEILGLNIEGPNGDSVLICPGPVAP